MSEVFLRAAEIFEETGTLGELLWAMNGYACYLRRVDGDNVLTLLAPGGPPVEVSVAGIDLGALR